MKTLTALILIFMFQLGAVYASCEANVLEGGHSAESKADALEGAREDAKDLCYPGEVEFDKYTCREKAVDMLNKPSSIVHCRQTVVCTLCGEDLLRKVESEIEHDTK